MDLTVDGSEIRRSETPVEGKVVYLIIYDRFLAPSLWLPDFWTINSMSLPITHTIHVIKVYSPTCGINLP